MTGDKVDKATMTYGNRGDMWVANKVRMLMRDDLDHEFVCVGARDRIMYLSQEVERLTALCDGYRGEVEGLRQQNALYRSNVKAFGSAIWDENEAEWAGKVTRARADGLEEAAKIADTKALNQDCLGMGMQFYIYGKKVGEGIAAAIRARATKDNQ